MFGIRDTFLEAKSKKLLLEVEAAISSINQMNEESKFRFLVNILAWISLLLSIYEEFSLLTVQKREQAAKKLKRLLNDNPPTNSGDTTALFLTFAYVRSLSTSTRSNREILVKLENIYDYSKFSADEIHLAVQNLHESIRFLFSNIEDTATQQRLPYNDPIATCRRIPQRG